MCYGEINDIRYENDCYQIATFVFTDEFALIVSHVTSWLLKTYGVVFNDTHFLHVLQKMPTTQKYHISETEVQTVMIGQASLGAPRHPRQRVDAFVDPFGVCRK